MPSDEPTQANPDGVDGADERGGPSASIDRRRLLKTAGIAGAALWVTPTLVALDASPAAASSCSCGGATGSNTFLTLRTRVTGTPTACSKPTAGATGTLATFCRSDSTQAVYLWGTNNPLDTAYTYAPLFDDIGIITVTENRVGGITRYGNIYRFQNYCRHGTNVPTTLLSSTATQRVYTGLDVNTWDYLPPQPAGGSPETTDPGTWWTNSQPNGTMTATTSIGNPGYTVLTPWHGKIDISLLFGNTCGSFTVTVEDWNRYQEYKWSDILIGTAPPPGA